MNYSQHYNNLINRAKTRELQDVFEVHHIIPKCLGGDNTSDNLVSLTPEEHYVAHQLLVKIYPQHLGLKYAAVQMCTGRPNNKLYGWVRRQFIKSVTGIPKTEQQRAKMSMTRKQLFKEGKLNHSGENNPYYGKRHTPEEKQRISTVHKDKPKTEEHKRKIAEAQLGSLGHNYGKPGTMLGKKHTDEAIARMSQLAKQRQKTPCIHCGTECTPANLKRWHNNNCNSIKNIPHT